MAQPPTARRASSQPNLSDGKILDAVLSRYEDVDSYRTAKAEFFAANPKALDYKPMLVRQCVLHCTASTNRRHEPCPHRHEGSSECLCLRVCAHDIGHPSMDRPACWSHTIVCPLSVDRLHLQACAERVVHISRADRLTWSGGWDQCVQCIPVPLQ